MAKAAAVARKPRKAKRTLENPSTSLSAPDEWLYEALGASRTTSGVRVNRKTALTYAAVWRATNLISRDVGKLPLVIYKRLDPRGRERDARHPAYRLLRTAPNEYMTAIVFRMTMQAHALLNGNAYAYIERRGDGKPVSLLPIDPAVVTPVRLNGELIYVVKVGGSDRRVDPSSMLHIRGLSYDGLEGYSVIEYARDSFGMGLALREYGARFFANDATPGLAFQHPGRLSETAAKGLLENLDKMSRGLERKHRVILLQEGMKLDQFQVKATDAQLLESRGFEIREIANWFGVPPHKLGDPGRTAYASLEQENQSYLDDALDGWLVNWEQECAVKLLSEQEQVDDTHVVEFMRNALVRADIKARFEAYNIGRQMGVLSADDIRDMENMNPLPDGQGATYLVPLNMQSATALLGDPEADTTDEPAPADAPAEPADAVDLKEAARAEALAVATRMMRTIVERVEKSAERGKVRLLDALVASVPNYRDRAIDALLTPLSLAAGRSVAKDNIRQSVTQQVDALCSNVRGLTEGVDTGVPVDVSSATRLFISIAPAEIVGKFAAKD